VCGRDLVICSGGELKGPYLYLRPCANVRDLERQQKYGNEILRKSTENFGVNPCSSWLKLSTGNGHA